MRSSSTTNRFLASLLFGLVLGRPVAAGAEADLMISPTRLVLQDAAEGALTVTNAGTETLEVAAALVERSMDEGGALVPVTAPAYAASPYLIYAPNRVRLTPGQSQVIRLLVQLEPPAGERRSHLELVAAGASRTFRVTVPIFVRRGPPAVRVALRGRSVRSLPSGRVQAIVRLERTGAASAYGELSIELACPGGAPVTLATRKGLAVYSERAWRDVTLEFAAPAGAARTGCRLEARFGSLETPGHTPSAVLVTY